MTKEATERYCGVLERSKCGSRVTRRYVGSAAAEAVVLSLIRAHSTGI